MRLAGVSHVSGWASVALLLAAGLRTPAPHAIRTELSLFTSTHAAMGTEYTLYLYDIQAAHAAEVSDEVFEEIDRIDQLLSNYKESSELSRINREAAAGPVTTDPETMDFLVQSVRWSRASDGAFDITVGRLMKAWGFYRHQGRVPPEAELEHLRLATGWEKIRLDPADDTVRFSSPGVELDPGGIGKGFAVDAAVRLLRAEGVSAAMLSAGGSTVYALGAPPGTEGWRVVVPGPLPSRETLTTVVLRDTSLSSADCSQKQFTIGKHVFCHIMDPRRMRPVEGRVQVSVIDPSATASDALSNVIFVEPPAESVRTLRTSAPEAMALIVSGEPAQAHCFTYHWRQPIDNSHCTLN